MSLPAGEALPLQTIPVISTSAVDSMLYHGVFMITTVELLALTACLLTRENLSPEEALMILATF